jgi:hypothetical protein
MAGPMEYLSDCLIIYDGVIKEAPEYNEDEIKLNVRQSIIHDDVMLPETKVSEIFSGAPIESLPKGLPIIYGRFQSDVIEHSEVGLAKTIQVGIGPNLKFAVADHAVHATGTILPYIAIPEVIDPALLLNHTLTSGSTNSYFTSSTNKIRIYIFPDHVLSNSGDEDQAAYWKDEDKALDRDDSTYGIVQDFDGTAYVHGNGFLCNRLDDFIAEKMARDDGAIHCAVKVDDLTTGDVLDPFRMRCTFSRQSSGSGFQYDTADSKTLTKGIPGTWQISGPHTDCHAKSGPFYLSLYGYDDDLGGDLGDGISGNLDMIAVYIGYMYLEYFLDVQVDGWAYVSGMDYGSWITGRSSDFSSGQVIEEPAGIIESIARERLGFVDANIDLPSFIDCEYPGSTAIKARLNITDDNAMTALDAIQLVAEQSLMSVIFTADGKLRAVNLNVTSPSSDKTIYYADLVEGSLDLKRSDFIVNDMTIMSRWQAEYGIFADSDNYSSSDSQAVYGVRKYPGELLWPGLTGVSLDTVAGLLIGGGGTKGLWDQAHIIVTFTTVGLKHVDIEIGDWIEFDATSFDPRLKCYGATWGSREFLVTDRRFDGAKGITFTVYELRLGESWT